MLIFKLTHIFPALYNYSILESLGGLAGAGSILSGFGSIAGAFGGSSGPTFGDSSLLALQGFGINNTLQRNQGAITSQHIKEAGNYGFMQGNNQISSLTGDVKADNQNNINQQNTAAIIAKLKDELAKKNAAPPWYQKLGMQLAEQTLQTVGTGLINRGVSELLPQSAPNTQPPLHGSIAGNLHKQFMDTAYPGTNAWERLGGSTGSAAGGTIAATTGAGAKINSSLIGAASQRDVANISSLPHLKTAELEFQKTPSIIRATQAHGRLDEEKGIGQNIENKWIQTLNNSKQSLMDAQRFHEGSKDVKTQQETSKIIDQQILIVQQVKTEIQKSGIALQDKRIKQALANLSALAREHPTAAKWAGATGALITALRGLGGILPAALKGSKKK